MKKEINQKMLNSAFKDNHHFKYGINLWTGEPNKPVFYTQEMKKAIREIKKP